MGCYFLFPVKGGIYYEKEQNDCSCTGSKRNGILVWCSFRKCSEVSVNNVTIHGNTVPTYLTDYTGEAFMQRIQQETDEHFSVTADGTPVEVDFDYLNDEVIQKLNDLYGGDDVALPDSIFADGVTYGNVYVYNYNLYDGSRWLKLDHDNRVKIPMYYNGDLLTVLEFADYSVANSTWVLNNGTSKEQTEVIKAALEKSENIAIGEYVAPDYKTGVAVYVDGEILNVQDSGATLPTIDEVIANDKDTKEDEVSTLVGDVNLDGNIDLTDAVMLGKIISGSVEMNDQQKQNADCTKDSSVTTDDTQLLMQFLMHNVETL